MVDQLRGPVSRYPIVVDPKNGLAEDDWAGFGPAQPTAGQPRQLGGDACS